MKRFLVGLAIAIGFLAAFVLYAVGAVPFTGH